MAMGKTWTAESVNELVRSFQDACVMAAAVDLDLFTVLAEGPLGADQVAARVEADRRGMTILLDALGALGLLIKQGDRYRTPPELVPLLASDAPGSVRAMARHQANCLRRWAELPWIVKTGRLPPRRPSLFGEAADLESFIQAMDNVSGPVAERLVGELGIRDFDHLLDVGGASGTWTIAWLRAAAPGARATLFDRPEVLPLARERLEGAGLADRVTLVGGDFDLDPLPAGADLAWVSAIVHQNSRANNRDLLSRVARALRPGGRVLIRDMVMEESRTAPVAGALFAVNMLAGTEAGGTFTLGELREDLEAAGFAGVRLARPDPAMHAVVEAMKPA